MNPRSLKVAFKSWMRPSARDLATRDWKLNAPRHAPSAGPSVVFCAPLMGRHMADDWTNVSNGVTRMVASLIAQTDPNWTLLLTSQDRPDGLPDDPRITFVPFDQDVTGIDKLAKVGLLMDILPAHLAGADGYMHALDADDLLHPGVVDHIRRDNNGQGYWHKYGGMLDADTGLIARCGPRTFRYPTSRPFLSQCGSSAAIYVDFRGDRRAAQLATRFYRAGHRSFLRTARAFGVKLSPLPFPSALYVMNTGENLRQKRGLMHHKMRYLQQNKLPARQQAEQSDSFGLTALNAAASGPEPAASRRG